MQDKKSCELLLAEVKSLELPRSGYLDSLVSGAFRDSLYMYTRQVGILCQNWLQLKCFTGLRCELDQTEFDNVRYFFEIDIIGCFGRDKELFQIPKPRGLIDEQSF